MANDEILMCIICIIIEKSDISIIMNNYYI